MTNITGEELFAKIFGDTLVKFSKALASKLKITKDKKEYQKIVENINENRKKLHEVDETSPFNDYVIQPSDRRINLIDAINLILDFCKKTELDGD